jgi:hypothetical protein
MAKKYRSEALKTLHETMQGLPRVGLVDTKTMREFDASCLRGERGQVLHYKFSLPPADRGGMPAPCRAWRTPEKVIFQDLTLNLLNLLS